MALSDLVNDPYSADNRVAVYWSVASAMLYLGADKLMARRKTKLRAVLAIILPPE